MDRKSKRLSSNKKKASDSLVDGDVDSDEENASKSRSKRAITTVKKSSIKNTTAVIKSGIMNDERGLITASKSKEITPQVKRSREKHHNISCKASPKKRNRTITDWVNNPQSSQQTADIIPCPACKREVLYKEINNHLDVFCQGRMNEAIAGEFSETMQENIPLTPRNNKQKLSNIIAQNKASSTDASKSPREMTIEVPVVEVLTDAAIKSTPNSQNLISSNKSSRIIPIDVDDEEDILEGLSNELAKPILNDSDSDDMENLKCQENLREIKSALCENMGSEKMENEKANEWNNHKNDRDGDMEWCDNDAESDTESLSHYNLKIAEEGTVFENEGMEDESIDLTEEHIDITENQEQQSDPYYLVNFKIVLDSVLSNEEDKNLFNDADHKVINQFKEFPLAAQKLYIRLFQRKPGWFRCSKLNYPKIAEDLDPVLNTLVNSGFLENEKKLTDLKEALQLLSVVDLKDLAKDLHVIPKSTQQKGLNKERIKECLIKHGGSQKTLFGNGSDLLLKKAKEALGTCVRVSSDCKSVFSRLLLLFSMNIIPEDEDNKFNGQSQQLSTLMLVNMGKVVYPQYSIIRQQPIFKDRNHMIKFVEAYQEKHDMYVALEETKDMDAAYSFYPKAAKCFKDVLYTLNKKKKTFSSSLPVHLRCFTPEWVYTKMCYLGVEVLQKKKQYEEAVGQLELLLKQDTYCADCRGLWWERLALNVHQHLKQPDKALKIIRQGLEDSHVRFGRRLALVQRAKKILSSDSSNKKKKNYKENLCDIDEALLVEPRPAESITIKGKRSAKGCLFMSYEVTKTGHINEDIKNYLPVEEFALAHYRQQGYDEGIHGETSTFTTLYGFYFWDVLFFNGVPDVFRGKFQAAPLDINYDTFYAKRKEEIEQRLQEIENCSKEDLLEMLKKSWVEHEGQLCSGVSWDRFKDVEQAKQFVSCIGSNVLSGIFKHFAQDMRHWHSGMPDLVVWNSSNLQYRIVEVKGPGDRLSTKQQIWLDELASFGATVEVCYANAVGGKKLLKAQ